MFAILVFAELNAKLALLKWTHNLSASPCCFEIAAHTRESRSFHQLELDSVAAESTEFWILRGWTFSEGLIKYDVAGGPKSIIQGFVDSGFHIGDLFQVSLDRKIHVDRTSGAESVNKTDRVAALQDDSVEEHIIGEHGNDGQSSDFVQIDRHQLSLHFWNC